MSLKIFQSAWKFIIYTIAFYIIAILIYNKMIMDLLS